MRPPGSHAISIRQRLVSFVLFSTLRLHVYRDLMEIRTMADNKCLWLLCHDVKQNTWPSIYFLSLIRKGRQAFETTVLLFHSFKRPSQCPQHSIHTRRRPIRIGRASTEHLLWPPRRPSGWIKETVNRLLGSSQCVSPFHKLFTLSSHERII